MASAKCMSTAQCDDLLVIEAHPIENVSQMFAALRCIRKASVGCAGCNVLVLSAGSVWDSGALHLLDSTNASENPEVRVGNPRIFGCSVVSYTSAIEIAHIPLIGSKKSLAELNPALAP